MKYEIIEFINGKFGIRRRSFIEYLFNFGGSYRDFCGSFYRWRKSDDYNFKNCQLPTKEAAENWLLRIKNKYAKP